MLLLALYIALAIGVSFLCSILEAVLLSITPSYVAALEAEGSKAGQLLQELKRDIDRPLAAILSLNTVAHTVGAAGAGAQAAVVFGDAAVGVFSGVLTLGILVLSEIIPKTLGAVYWRGLAPLTARLLRPLIVVTYPLVLLSQALSKLIARGKEGASVSREELVALARLGTEEGVFDPQESHILRNLLRFRDLSARDVMTPRTVMLAFPETTPLREIAEADVPFSRLPVFDRDRDNVTGWVLKDEVLEAVAAGRGDEPAARLRRPLLTVPDTLPLPALFDRLLERHEHIALVVGEYGGTQGLATVEDVVETLLGLEIVDEADTEHDMQVAARQRWAERARKLGLIEPDASAPDEEALAETQREREGGVRLGITGGVPPVTTDVPDEDDAR
ncbi:MAG: hemolysin family protein [Rhodothermales bacterium]|nr:hemolysin family protein [Rhodothermales bacterium]